MSTNNEDDNLAFSGVVIALIAILITIVIFFIYRSKKSARRSVLFTGLCNSGKTLLYSRLIHKRFANTYTSMKENIGEYIIDKSSVRVVDIPGHERVREKFFEKYKSDARAVVYVIDSSVVQQEIRDIAEYLYNILSDACNNKFKFLILCNKQDIPLAKNSSAVKSMLEKELTMLERTKSSQLDSVDPKVKRGDGLVQGDKFDFSLLPIDVQFVDASANNGETDTANIDPLENWLAGV